MPELINAAARFRFIVFTCRDPRTDFRRLLVDALQERCETYYVWVRRRPLVSGPGALDSGRELSVLGLLRLIRSLPRDDRINVYLNSTNTYFPGLSVALRGIAPPGIWCFDMHDDLRYHNRGWKRLREGLIVSTLSRLFNVVVHAAPALQELFPHSVHLGNASHIGRVDLTGAGWDDILVIASFDERFDFDFMARVAELCPDLRFHLHGWTRPGDAATLHRVRELDRRHDNVRYHGPYTTADLPAILGRYRISVAPYLSDSPLTHYIDPLRFYHCLNAGLEVISTGIPQARYMNDYVNIVASAEACRDALHAIRSGQRRKQPAYTPITWEQRADQLIRIIDALPRAARLGR